MHQKKGTNRGTRGNRLRQRRAKKARMSEARNAKMAEGKKSGSESAAAFPCTSCDKKFKRRKNLKAHYKIRHENFLCDLCDTLFESEENLDRHYLLIHFQV